MLLEQMKELWIKLSDHRELIDKFKKADDDSEYDIILKEAGCSFTVSQIKSNIKTTKDPGEKISSALDTLNDYDLEFVSGGTGVQGAFQPDSRIPDAVTKFFMDIQNAL